MERAIVKTQKRIEIVRSNVDGLSSLSQPSAEAIKALLEMHYDKVNISIINNTSDLKRLVEIQPDLVFLGMKFLPKNIDLGKHDSKKVWISEHLDNYGIAYTGSCVDAAGFDLDKTMAKNRVQLAGLKTSPFFIATPSTYVDPSEITIEYPLFIKPTRMGGGQGIDSTSVVHNFEQFKAKVQSIHDLFQSESLVESYLTGREFSVAILNNGYSSDYLVMPIELVASADINGNRILSQEVKNSNSEKVSNVDDVILKTEINRLALGVFKALGARDYGRIDIRLDSKGIPQFLEANLIPSLIEGYGSFPKACLMNIGMDYEAMILRIVDLGFKHAPSDVEITYFVETDLLIAA